MSDRPWAEDREAELRAHEASAITNRLRACGYSERRVRTTLRRLFMRASTHECSGVWVSSLPPAWPNHFSVRRCPYSRRFYALRYGGTEHGIAYQWLGLRIEIGKRR